MMIRPSAGKLLPEKLLRGTWQASGRLPKAPASGSVNHGVSRKLGSYLTTLVERSGLRCEPSAILLSIVAISILSGVSGASRWLADAFPIADRIGSV